MQRDTRAEYAEMIGASKKGYIGRTGNTREYFPLLCRIIRKEISRRNASVFFLLSYLPSVILFFSAAYQGILVKWTLKWHHHLFIYIVYCLVVNMFSFPFLIIFPIHPSIQPWSVHDPSSINTIHNANTRLTLFIFNSKFSYMVFPC